MNIYSRSIYMDLIPRGIYLDISRMKYRRSRNVEYTKTHDLTKFRVID